LGRGEGLKEWEGQIGGGVSDERCTSHRKTQFRLLKKTTKGRIRPCNVLNKKGTMFMRRRSQAYLIVKRRGSRLVREKTQPNLNTGNIQKTAWTFPIRAVTRAIAKL